MLILILIALISSTAAIAARPSISLRVSNQIVQTWTCQSLLGVERTPARPSPWAIGHHNAFWKAAYLNKWIVRRKACLATLHAHDAVIRRLNAGISRYYREQRSRYTPMAGLGATLERIGRRYGISPYFMFATSVTESSGGLAACANNEYNVWGLSSCGPGWYVPPFRTWAEAIDFYARFLTGRTTVTSGWPNAETTYDYSGYAECSECWGRKTAQHMAHLFGVGNGVRYP